MFSLQATSNPDFFSGRQANRRKSSGLFGPWLCQYSSNDSFTMSTQVFVFVSVFVIASHRIWEIYIKVSLLQDLSCKRDSTASTTSNNSRRSSGAISRRFIIIVMNLYCCPVQPSSKLVLAVNNWSFEWSNFKNVHYSHPIHPHHTMHHIRGLIGNNTTIISFP